MKNIILFPIVFLCAVMGQEAHRFALLPIKVTGIDKATSESITELTQNALVSLSQGRFVERTQIESVLNEQILQDAGIIDNVSKMGELLSVQNVIVGSLTQLGQMSYFTLRIINADNGEILKTVKNSGEFRLEEYYDWLIEPTAKQLFITDKRDWSIQIKSVSGVNGDKYSGSDCWVQLLHKNEVVGRTKVIQNSNNPIFNERFVLKEYSDGDLVAFKVYDNDYSGKHLLGIVETDSLYSGAYQFEVQNNRLIIVTSGTNKNPIETIELNAEPENLDGQLILEVQSK